MNFNRNLPHPDLRKRVSIPPSVFFTVFLATNVLLAFTSLPLEVKLWVGLFGFLIPLAVLFLQTPKASAGEVLFPHGELFSSPVAWAWAAVLGMSLVPRFWRLVDIPLWPLHDEASHAFIGMDLAQNWDWRFFRIFSQLPPFYFWGLGLWFKGVEPSLSSFWFFPALLGALSVPLSYFALRAWASRSFSFLCFAFTALSFWPVYVGRFNHPAVLLVFWEWAAVLLLGRFWRARNAQALRRAGAWLGVWTGLGFYTAIHWPLVACLLAAAVWARGRTSGGKGWISSWTFFLAAGVTAAPFLVVALKEGYGDYIRVLWAFNKSLPGESQWRAALAYWTSLLWGAPLGPFAYRPFWGGYLDPLLGALFFLGCGELYRFRGDRRAQWITACFFLFLVPGFITRSLEYLRVVEILPVVMVTAALGFSRLLLPLPAPQKVLASAAALFFCLGAGLYHLAVPYHQAWQRTNLWEGYSKSIEQFRAFQILKTRAALDGPGFILTNLLTEPSDQSLALASYRFNAAWNPRLGSAGARWVAVFVDSNYRPFLSRDFPEGRSYELSYGLDRPSNHWTLVVIPLSPGNRDRLGHWVEVDRKFRAVTGLTIQCAATPRDSKIVAALNGDFPLLGGDPFLQSCFWEKMKSCAYIGFQAAREKGRKAEDNGDPRNYFLACRNAVAFGYPSANQYFDYAWVLVWQKDFKEAKRVLEKAVHCPVDLTSAGSLLDKLDQTEK